MSHNHEPENTPRRHKPVIAALVFVLGVVVVSFLVFTPGADENNNGINTTVPPGDTPVTAADGTSMEPAEPGFNEEANTPASGNPGPVGAADMPAGAETESPGSPETPLLEPAESAPAN